MKMKNVLVIVVLLGLVGWGLFQSGDKEPKQQETSTEMPLSKVPSGVEGLGKGNVAPDFELKTLDGKKVLLSDFRGKKVILNMWATWCPPCRAEMPDMQKFYQANKDKGIEVLGVNLTTSEKNKDNIGAFIKEFGLTFTVVLDEEGKVGEKYQAVSIPTSYIIDSQGVIQQKIVGPMNEEMMGQLMSSIK